MKRINLFAAILMVLFMAEGNRPPQKTNFLTQLREGFMNPPDSVKPGVYWYFMDGNLSREGITEDLESMKKAGIAHVLFLEVNVGIPRGKVDFLSEEWQKLFVHAVRECERLGITLSLGAGPGWTGSGGPWVTGKQSMQHLVSSYVIVSGEEKKKAVLPVPQPQKPFFGESTLTHGLRQKWNDFYEDVAVLAFPSPADSFRIKDIDEKALYYRAPYTSQRGVKPFLPAPARYPEIPENGVIKAERIIDVSRFLHNDGSLDWDIPPGEWMIMRFGVRNNGAVTRPAPVPGLGFECDKFDTTALNDHLSRFTDILLQKTGKPGKATPGGWKMLHMDSWEMGSQNWSPAFREEFRKRRGYDPLPYFPVYAGFVVGNPEKSERFLWDLRLTSQELILENHASHLKKYGRRNNLGLSIEPYDMNPTSDMALGALADVAMCEFWSKGYGFNSSFSCIQAASIAHTNGIRVVAAEAFTASRDGWKLYPGVMKDQGDWAFAAGVNRFVYHTFQHQLPGDALKPGITMGPYGVHWDRNQTWWPMAGGYHNYIARCQYLLQQGTTVADIVYLIPEGAPHVFRAPSSALEGTDILPDRKGYNFDGCSPSQLLLAEVKDNRLRLPGGAAYRLLVLPSVETMTPELIRKIAELVKHGATVAGNPPLQSPSLADLPAGDSLVCSLATKMWTTLHPPATPTEIPYGKGKICWGGELSETDSASLYPVYDATASVLKAMGISEDFSSTGPVRYTHRTTGMAEIYFVSNRTDQPVDTKCTFRSPGGVPQLWNPLTGETRSLPVYIRNKGNTVIPLRFGPSESYFVVFCKPEKISRRKEPEAENFKNKTLVSTVKGSWNVFFDPVWGGPGEVIFKELEEWTARKEEGIRYYSGTAVYHTQFTIPDSVILLGSRKIFLDLGEVEIMARVRVNGKETAVLWTYPWQADITKSVKPGENQLEIEVANLWPNRLIGDEQKKDDGISEGKWPAWFPDQGARTSGRYTFTTARFYKADSPLLKSGLLGPVRILAE